MSEKTTNLLRRFFPTESFSPAEVEEAINKSEIFDTADKILPYLQTALLDNKVLEVELDGVPRIYFTRLEDDPPEPPLALEQEVNSAETDPVDADDADETTQEGDAQPEEKYQKGGYLLPFSYLITLPLEPGMGNLHLRNSKTILLRMFTKSFAVEFGTTFSDLTKIFELPVLKLGYPQVARVVTEVREYRAKVVDSLDFVATVDSEEFEGVEVRPVNVSLQGMAFATTKKQQRALQIDQSLTLMLYLDDELLLRIGGTLKHLSRIRKEHSIEYICGVEFDMDTRVASAATESIVASVQRAHLQELADLSHNSGIELIR